MGFADAVMRAENGTLHEAEAAFGGVDACPAAKPRVFIGLVIDRRVAGKFIPM